MRMRAHTNTLIRADAPSYIQGKRHGYGQYFVVQKDEGAEDTLVCKRLLETRHPHTLSYTYPCQFSDVNFNLVIASNTILCVCVCVCVYVYVCVCGFCVPV